MSKIRNPLLHALTLEEDNNIHHVMARMYRHFFAGGTFDQMREDDVIIIILNPAVKKGTIKRKSYGSLYERTVIYLNTANGYAEVRTPGSWGSLDIAEVQDRLNELDANKLV